MTIKQMTPYATANYRLNAYKTRLMNTEGPGFYAAKNATKPNPFIIIPLQSTRKENNWETKETLVRAAVTLEMERAKWPNP
jgi:hypothetical protein